MRKLLLAVVLILIAAVAWVGVRGYLARDHIDSAVARLPTFEQQMSNLEIEAARATLADIQSDTGAARDLTSDPVWNVVGAFPWGGQNLEAVGTATATVDDVVTEGLTGLVDAGAGFVAFRDAVGSGELDSSGLTEAAAGVDALDTSLTEAREELAAIDRRYLVDRVEAAVDELEASLDVAEQAGTRFSENLVP